MADEMGLGKTVTPHLTKLIGSYSVLHFYGHYFVNLLFLLPEQFRNVLLHVLRHSFGIGQMNLINGLEKEQLPPSPLMEKEVVKNSNVKSEHGVEQVEETSSDPVSSFTFHF